MQIIHYSVMKNEVLTHLVPFQENGVVVDCTLGEGGHTEAFLETYPDLTVVGVDRDEELLNEALQIVDRAESEVVMEKEHLNHYRSSLARMLSVIRRLRLGLRFCNGVGEQELERQCGQIRRHMDEVRDVYIQDWLRNNKWPNIEVSLRVFDEVIESYGLLPDVMAEKACELDGYTMLDLSGIMKENFLPVGGIPIGMRRFNGVPFLFAGVDRTHAQLNDESPEVRIEFPSTGVAELHLIISGHRTADEPHPSAELELLHSGGSVFREELLDITHLCDWWAPLGEHIWAGGGMAYVDRERVRYALKPGHMYGLAHLSGFDIAEGSQADTLRIRAMEGEEVCLFAATIQAGK